MAELILIRHAEAVGQGRYLGRQSNPPLSEAGRMQAEALSDSKIVKSCVPLDSLVFVSPQQRAAETAALAFPGFVPRTIPEFAEIDFGLWEGLTWQEITAADAAGYKRWLADPVRLSPPEGETLAVFNERVEKGLKKVMSMFMPSPEFSEGVAPDKAVLVVHGGVIRSILCNLLGLSADKHSSFGVSNASVSLLRLWLDSDNPRSGHPSAVLEFLNLKHIN